jgi:Ca-activated chloride channel family protein
MKDIERGEGGARKRWILVGALVLLTVGVSAAAHVSGRATLIPVGDTDSGSIAHFSAAQTRPVSFRGNLDRTAVLQGTSGQVRMELILGAEEREDGLARHMPTDLVVILDRSGSMSGTKMSHARAAVRELIAQLGAEDRFGLVTYADGAGQPIGLEHPSADGRWRWRQIVDSIHAAGGTDMSAGLDLALGVVERSRTANRIPRVILISDGMANQGDASVSGLTGRARKAAHAEYMLSTVGVGEDFNEDLMVAIADSGTGNYYYLQSAENLALVFMGEFDSARTTVASGLVVNIDPAPGVRVLDAAGYPLERSGAGVRIRPGALFSGQQRRIWVTLGVPSGEPASIALGDFSLSYTDSGERHTLRFEDMPVVACVENRQDYLAGIDQSAWGRAVIEEGYGRLQDEVADSVGRGDFQRANEAIERYVSEAEELNQSFGLEEVDAQLGAARLFRQEVRGVASSPEPAAKNLFRKSKQQDGMDRRRQGSKLAPKTEGEK